MEAPMKCFESLRSDEVFIRGMLASDTRSLWRQLARTKEVQDVARGLASDPDRIRQLCHFVDGLLNQPYDRSYRHPDDIAICAALVILEQSPLSVARNLFARLRDMTAPSLAWVQRMAEYCDQRFVPCGRTVLPSLVRGGPLPRPRTANEGPDIHWATPDLDRRRHSLALA